MKPVTFAAVSSLALALALSAAVPLQAQPATAHAATVPSLEQIFRAEPYRGENAKAAAFSRSGRYLAYLWSPFGEPGSDLWVHDTRTGKSTRVTSPQVMAAFEAPEDMARFDKKLRQRNDEFAERQAREVAQQAYLLGDKVDLSQWESAQIEVLKQELAEKKAKEDAQKAADKAEADAEKQAMAALAAKRAGKPVPAAAPASAASSPDKKDDKEKEKELWELRDELKKKLVRDKLKPADLYPGPAQFAWARKADELVFQYRGGLYRWAVGDKAPTQVVATQRELRLVGYTADDSGVLFTDDTRVLRAGFRQPGIQVVNRELIHPDDEQKKYRIAETAISEDGRWMSLVAKAPLKGADDKPAASAPTGRQVEIMNYSERWATAKKVSREVSDDKRTEKPLALYIRQLPTGANETPRKQPEPVFTNAGGDVWFEMSDVAWARDGSRYAFTTWERDKELLRVYVGKADESAKPEVVLERRGDVGHEVVNVLDPRFTPDGKTLVLALDEAGWRQPYAIDVATKALRPLMEGEFEAHQVVGFTADSKAMFVLANQGDAAAMNVLRVDLASGAAQVLGAAGEFHRAAAASEDGRWVAANAGNWAQRPELKLLAADGKAAPRTLTDSSDKAWGSLALLQPERFAFTNRHGDRIEAYVFKPAGWQATDKRPGIVYVYGGPLNDRHIVEVDSFQNTAYLFGQYMAAKHGYVTIAVDPRGHSNYGRKFSDANWERAGEPQAEDLEDLVKLLPTYGVDTTRVGLNGWSFGGFQTQYTMYTRPDLFAAGIAGAGPTEWENYNSWYSGRTIGKATDRSKPVLRKYSLLPLAKGLKHPLMLVHGMQDPNVLFQDTVNVYRELLDSGKESLVELFLDPDGVHALGGVVKPAGWHRKYEAFWIRTLAPRTVEPR